MMLRLAAAAALLVWQTAAVSLEGPSAEPKYFRYERPLNLASDRAGQTCSTLDATVFAHAATESLNDLRIYARNSTEIPFTLTESSADRTSEESAIIRNLGARGDDIVFDLEMPHRAYTAVTLDLAAKNFLATAKVSGSDGHGGAPVDLGSFALFDLSAQHLSRSTTLPLQESTFPELHVTLHLTPSPGSQPQVFEPRLLQGANVPPSREAQTLYTSVAEIRSVSQRGHETIATAHLPAHVPVERISFSLDPAFHKNFLRAVNVTAKPDDMQDSAATETLSGEISHVHLPTEIVQDPSRSDVETLSMDAVLGADLQHGATVEIAIENGDDTPLPIRSIRMEMRQRRLCFDATAGSGPYAVMYGDEALHAPEYDYARLFAASANPAAAALGDEQLNPSHADRVDSRPYSERHPELLWVVLIAVVAVLGTMAYRSTRQRHHS